MKNIKGYKLIVIVVILIIGVVYFKVINFQLMHEIFIVKSGVDIEIKSCFYKDKEFWFNTVHEKAKPQYSEDDWQYTNFAQFQLGGMDNSYLNLELGINKCTGQLLVREVAIRLQGKDKQEVQIESESLRQSLRATDYKYLYSKPTKDLTK